MTKKTYTTEIVALIPLLGGIDNIISYTHCVSRIRLVLKDNTKANSKEIEELDNVKGTVQPIGQYHIVIGPDVNNYFAEFKKYLTSKTEKLGENITNESTVKKGKWYQRLLQHFSEIFIPLVPALIAGGLILGFRNILEANWNGEGTSLVSISGFAKGLDDFLWIPAQAVFWYIPVIICWSIFAKMGGSPVLGIIIGLTLLLPPLVDIFEIAKGAKNSLWIFDVAPTFDFGAWSFPWKIQYTGQVIPTIGVAFFGVYLEKGLNRIVHAVLKQIFVPLLTILLSFTVGLCLIGPVGYIIGSAISVGLRWALVNPIAKYFFGPILGLLYAPIVITGVHTMLNAVMIQDTVQIGGTFIFPILCISNIAQGSASLMFTINNRKNPKMKEIGISATTSAWLAVTEPALYGINLRFLYPFLASIVGSASGAMLLTVAGVTSNGIGNGAWLGILSIQSFSQVQGVQTFIGTGYTWFILSALLTMSVTMALTWFLEKLPRFTKLRDEILQVKGTSLISFKKQPKVVENISK
ncbi:PTS transporter subunit EIIC [Spiroplasma citri]|uniref:PTS enzyme II trehalose-specific IIBC component n=1 Tax=Spiroplasma citri TaxID=2133 RepID=Q6XK12_SPICI|nr:PTS transporter subunit EIIC [Spiroplasma citri]AAP55644.1 PTS enzyme II trehalose-specific IIBC component [Spiroplasma citri]WFG98829.1 PTS transporter subunit EIIC [Spiroplasma citri]CAK98696.1 putative pts enzyme II trehalose-specific IIbc component transmembrane protein [Spiroplasma citri]